MEAALTPKDNVTPQPVSSLHFDKHNPRLAEYGIDLSSTEEEIISLLWEAMDVREIVQSIAASGYFANEALIATREKGKLIIIEGNRRLAAVKALLDENLARTNGWEIPILNKKAKDALREIPVIISTREDSWRYLGFKHVNGAAKWSSYAKAIYIAEVHKLYRIGLTEIANQIGDRHQTVQRLYRGLMVIDQAERAKVYDRADRFRQRFAFSHLYTGIDLQGIGSFLSLRSEIDESPNPVPKDKLKELGEICLWLYGSKKANIPPVVQSQNPDLRLLNSVVANREAIAALRSGTDLQKAYEISRPSTSVFEDALMGAKRELTTARAYLTTGYDKSESLLRIAGSIAEMADDIYNEMDRKQNPERKKTRLVER